MSCCNEPRHIKSGSPAVDESKLASQANIISPRPVVLSCEMNILSSQHPSDVNLTPPRETPRHPSLRITECDPSATERDKNHMRSSHQKC